MQKLTNSTWYRTIPQDLKLILTLLGEAFVSLLTFEIQDMRVALVLAWMTIRYEHDVIDGDA